MKLIVIILLMWNIIQMGHCKKIGYFTNVECPAPYTDMVYDYKCSLAKNSDGIPVLNVYFKLRQDISEVTMHIKLRAKQGDKPEETVLVFDLNVCDALVAEHEHYYLKMVFKELRRTSNIPESCPLKKDFTYKVEGFGIDTSLLPTYLPDLSWSSLLYFNISNVKVATLNTYGKLSEKLELSR